MIVQKKYILPLLLLFFYACAGTKNYAPLHYNKPVHVSKPKVDIGRAPYIGVKNGNEYIQYNKVYTKVKFYSPADKNTNIITLQSNQSVYDGFIIEGDAWFREDIITALYMIEKKCNEEYDTIRSGIIDEKGFYHKWVRLVKQSSDIPSRAVKETDEILVGRQEQEEKGNGDYYKVLGAVLVSEGYRLIYWDEWGPLPGWWYKKEGIKLQYRVLRKLNAASYRLKKLENALDEEDEEVFYRRLYEK